MVLCKEWREDKIYLKLLQVITSRNIFALNETCVFFLILHSEYSLTMVACIDPYKCGLVETVYDITSLCNYKSRLMRNHAFALMFPHISHNSNTKIITY